MAGPKTTSLQLQLQQLVQPIGWQVNGVDATGENMIVTLHKPSGANPVPVASTQVAELLTRVKPILFELQTWRRLGEEIEAQIYTARPD